MLFKYYVFGQRVVIALFIIVSMFFTISLKAQNSGEVSFTFSYETLNGEPKDDYEMRARMMADKTAEYARLNSYRLKFNAYKSNYDVEESLPNDDSEVAFPFNVSKFTFSNGIFYQNTKTNENLNQLTTMNELFLFVGNLRRDWQITHEHKRIVNYKCYKAILSCVGCDNN